MTLPSLPRLPAVAVAVTALAGCGGHPAPVEPAPLPVVTVAHPSRAEVRDEIALDGVVAASASVNLTARVAGTLQAAPFREGERVAKGQLLFVVEPEPYRQQVKLNQARVDQARAESERQQSLLRDDATSRSSVESALSTLQQAEANLALANLNLGYTEVRAPFDGVVGRRQVDVGNYVGASPGGTVLGTVLRLRPAVVEFSINERDLLRLRERAAVPVDGTRGTLAHLPVRAALQGDIAPSVDGVLDFVDHSVGSSTGSLALRASFPNDHLRLLPGLYAKVTIGAGRTREALLVPAVAVQADQQGSYVYVVAPDDTIVRRFVAAGGGFGSRREVTDGLGDEERVVVAGAGVRVGERVAPRTVFAPPPPSSPAVVAASREATR